MPNSKDLQLAAIMSESVAKKKSPILFACKDLPTREQDSGWQFWGHPDVDNDADDPKVWTLEEVLKLEPSLSEYLHLPVGVFLQRSSLSSPWSISKNN